MNIKKFKLVLLFSCIAVSTMLSSIATAATVDLLVLYDTHSKNYFGGDPQTAMTNWVNQMNAAYATSKVDIQLRLVGVRLHEDGGADQGAVLGNIRVNSTVLALRDQLGADFVAQLHKTGNCGVGYVAVDKNWTFNVVGPNCGPMAMIHELGHNMGLNHSRRQGDTTGTRYRYGVGYGVDSLFVDIMAYSQSFNNAPRQNLFSNPTLSCRGVPCGVPEGQSQEAYGAKALQNVRAELAGFRPTANTGTGFSRTIQAENYSSNKGVQLENTSDTGGGQNVGWIETTDWMAYNSINIPTSGTYSIDYRVASANGGGKLSLDLNGGATVLGQIDIPNTGGWQTWRTVTQTVYINAGTYNFGIYAVAGGWNINWFRIRK